MPLPTREELETRYGQMVAEQRAREAAAAQQMSQGVGGFVSGVGTGLMDQLRDFRDLAQKGGQIAGNYINDIAMMRDPTRNLPGYTDLAAMGEAATDPQTYINMGKAIYRQATGGPESLGRLVGQNINPLNMVRGLRPVMSELDVYHGTPHRFPATEANPLGEFDASKIGTGEGAQAYGKGIYFTENMDLAKGYQPRDPNAEEKLMRLYNQAQNRQDYNSMEVLEAAMLHRTADELREQFPRKKGLVGRIAKIQEQSPSSLYKADLPDEMIDRMLDYDKPINEHSQVVLDALEKAGINTQSSMRAGQMIEGQEAHLAKFGIPGMIYREGRGKGPRNFVVFPGEEKRVKILERK